MKIAPFWFVMDQKSSVHDRGSWREQLVSLLATRAILVQDSVNLPVGGFMTHLEFSIFHFRTDFHLSWPAWQLSLISTSLGGLQGCGKTHKNCFSASYGLNQSGLCIQTENKIKCSVNNNDDNDNNHLHHKTMDFDPCVTRSTFKP